MRADGGRERRLGELAEQISDRIDALKDEKEASKILSFPPPGKKRGAKGSVAEIVPLAISRSDIAYRYGLLRAVGTEGESRESLIQDGISHAERELSLVWLRGPKRTCER